MIREEFKVHGYAAIKMKKRRQERYRFPVTSTVVNKQVYKQALKIAGGDSSRLDVISHSEVVVRNSQEQVQNARSKRYKNRG